VFKNFDQTKKKNHFMLIVEVRDNESIDQALKRFKRKFQQSKVMQQVRGRREFTKPSVKRRHEVLKAVYKEQKRLIEGV
jgi:small subunit ribosomal protein S21